MSWARPPASRPTASIFCAWRNCASLRRSAASAGPAVPFPAPQPGGRDGDQRQPAREQRAEEEAGPGFVARHLPFERPAPSPAPPARAGRKCGRTPRRTASRCRCRRPARCPSSRRRALARSSSIRPRSPSACRRRAGSSSGSRKTALRPGLPPFSSASARSWARSRLLQTSSTLARSPPTYSSSQRWEVATATRISLAARIAGDLLGRQPRAQDVGADPQDGRRGSPGRGSAAGSAEGRSSSAPAERAQAGLSHAGS